MLLCLLFGTPGCQPAKPTVEPDAAQVSGETIALGTNSPQLKTLVIETAGRGVMPQVPLAGRLVWDEAATVRVFTPFGGIVRTLYADVDQKVPKDAPLTEIQSADFGQAQADARKAAGDLRRARQNLERLRDLFSHGAAPAKDVESAEADHTSALAEANRAQARLAIYGASADATEHGFLLPSPIAGVIVEKNVNVGQEVRPDQMLANTPQFTAPLFVVTDPSRLWLQIDATEVELPILRPGTEITFATRAFIGQTFTARVDTVSEFIDPNTRTIKVRGTVDNRRRLLKAEMFVNVNLPGQAVQQTSVPTQAVFLKGEKHYVFVEEEPAKFVRHEVQIGTEQDGHVLILSGVQPGQRVVTEGCLLLQRLLK